MPRSLSRTALRILGDLGLLENALLRGKAHGTTCPFGYLPHQSYTHDELMQEFGYYVTGDCTCVVGNITPSKPFTQALGEKYSYREKRLVTPEPGVTYHRIVSDSDGIAQMLRDACHVTIHSGYGWGSIQMGKQRILLDGVEYHRIVRETVSDLSGDCGVVSINGIRYRVKCDQPHELKEKEYPKPDATWSVMYQEEDIQKRDHISAQTRRAVLERDGHRCVMCGATSNLHLDHIVPHCNGGSSEIENLQALCQWCNTSKGGFTHLAHRFQSDHGRYWDGRRERILAQRLIQTMLVRGYTLQQIAEEMHLPSHAITTLVMLEQGNYDIVRGVENYALKRIPELYDIVKGVENYALKMMPELTALARFLGSDQLASGQ